MPPPTPTCFTQTPGRRSNPSKKTRPQKARGCLWFSVVVTDLAGQRLRLGLEARVQGLG